MSRAELYRLPERSLDQPIEIACFDHVSAFPAAVFESQRTMMWESVLTEWASLILRWLHVVAAVGWIGSSFSFLLISISV